MIAGAGGGCTFGDLTQVNVIYNNPSNFPYSYFVEALTDQFILASINGVLQPPLIEVWNDTLSGFIFQIGATSGVYTIPVKKGQFWRVNAQSQTAFNILGTISLDCAGGSSSSSTASNATIDSLSQVVSNLDSLMQIITPFFGCTDPTSCNYDSNAVIDNGSCIGLQGCTDNQSSNYNASATCDDGSCTPYVGMYAYGGIICWIDPNNPYTGTVCSEYDLPSTSWAAANSNVQSLNINGYSDWRLPSQVELTSMCSNQSIINSAALSYPTALGVSFQNGGCDWYPNCPCPCADWYWSDEAYQSSKHWLTDFSTCTPHPFASTYGAISRPVRSF